MKQINEPDLEKQKNDRKNTKKPPISKNVPPVLLPSTQTDQTDLIAQDGQVSAQTVIASFGAATSANITSTPKTQVLVAEQVSHQQAQLLEIQSYDDAEQLLSHNPDLIEPARVAFGTVVPTTQQNSFMDLAIRAAANDDPLSLSDALLDKRQGRLMLSQPEVSQLLEFADEISAKSPELALALAILITDDLTHLKETDLWKTQKAVVTATAKRMGVDALAIWEEINGKAQPDVTGAPNPVEPVKAEATTVPDKAPEPIQPRIKADKRKKRKTVRYEIRRVDGPPRWLMAMGLMGLMTLASCGICSMAIF